MGESGVMLFPCEGLLLNAGYNLSIAYEGGRAIVLESRDPQDHHASGRLAPRCHTIQQLASFAGNRSESGSRRNRRIARATGVRTKLKSSRKMNRIAERYFSNGGTVAAVDSRPL